MLKSITTFPTLCKMIYCILHTNRSDPKKDLLSLFKPDRTFIDIHTYIYINHTAVSSERSRWQWNRAAIFLSLLFFYLLSSPWSPSKIARRSQVSRAARSSPSPSKTRPPRGRNLPSGRNYLLLHKAHPPPLPISIARVSHPVLLLAPSRDVFIFPR